MSIAFLVAFLGLILLLIPLVLGGLLLAPPLPPDVLYLVLTVGLGLFIPIIVTGLRETG